MDDPLYEPGDRLVARRDGQLAGHLHIVKRVMHFGSLRVPIAEVRHLGVLPEFRGQGIGRRLLAAAEEKMVEDGAQLGLLRTLAPRLTLRGGWVVCGRHCFSTATSRNILARLMTPAPVSESPLAPVERPLTIRLWRQVEQDALGELYNRSTAGTWGPLVRNHAYWRWLVSRHAYDRIYVAIRGDNKIEWENCTERIVGYAVVQRGRILEIMTAPNHETAGQQLLARACGDAIERDELTVRLDAPPGHPLHALMESAGGQHLCCEADDGEVLMARLFDPLARLRGLREDILARAKAADFELPMELGLVVDGQKHQIVVTRRRTKIVEGKIGRSYLTCTRGQLSRLLLGHSDVARAEAAGRLEASTRVAIDIASVLLPQLPLWFPPLDDLPAE